MTNKILPAIIMAFAVILPGACSDIKKPAAAPYVQETISATTTSDDTMPHHTPAKVMASGIIETGTTEPAELLRFAKTLIGVPYLYASTDPAKGFDCSGFVTYVFNHFNIAVPRSSVDFTNVGTEIDYPMARPGDLILFTGTDSTIQIVGHMGIVVGNANDSLQFIHSSSGKANGVVVTKFENYYRSRFVKVVRIFP